MKKKDLFEIACIIVGIIVIFLCNAFLVAVLCWCLKAIGITSIFGWTVKFSLPLVIIFMIVTHIIRSLFPKKEKNN